MSRYQYCCRWSFARRVPREELTRDEAQARFAGRRKDPDDWFTVVARAQGGRGAGAIDFVLEVTEHADFINTFLCDEWGTIKYFYSFRREESGMFLFNTKEYKYPDEPRQFLQHEWLSVESFVFKVDGSMTRRLNEKSRPTIEEWEYHDVDMSDNWEPIPEFEQWDAIGKYRG
jgi:hypothetical protein